MTMIYAKRLAIMQPYVFPYLGYFHLIEASSQIVFYDDVNFIKGGWINRNKILVNGEELLFTIPLKKASPNKKINEVELTLNTKFVKTFLKQIKSAYSKAPFFNDVFPIILELFSHNNYPSVSDFAIKSILLVYEYLNMPIKWDKSSRMLPNTTTLKKEERIIEFCKTYGFNKYVNLSGGKELYSKDYFKENDVELTFIESQFETYDQFNQDFVPGLSIIDVLMFNDKQKVRDYIRSYKLV